MFFDSDNVKVRSSAMKQLENELLNMSNESVSNETVNEVLNKYHETDLPKFSLKPHLTAIDSIFGESTLDYVFEKLKQSDDAFMKHQLHLLGKMVSSYFYFAVRRFNISAPHLCFLFIITFFIVFQC